MLKLNPNKLNKTRLLAISIGIVYLFFGFLKFFPETSPADHLAKDTISQLTFGLIPPDISILLLAIMETGIGLFLIAKIATKTIIWVAIFHITMTFTPLLFFPDLSFTEAPFVPTLLGQYIVKNLIIFCALLCIYPDHKMAVPK
jgi:uncharacterized membrane protein YphA (DoxX/SURF4 family)